MLKIRQLLDRVLRLKWVIAFVAAASSLPSYADGEGVLLSLRTARVGTNMLAITSDFGLLGLNCAKMALIFPNTRGEINTLNSDNNSQGTWKDIAPESAKLICSSPLGSEFDILINSQARVIGQREAMPVAELSEGATIRVYTFNGERVGVADNHLLVGLECHSDLLSQFVAHYFGRTSTARLVLQKSDGVLLISTRYNGRIFWKPPPYRFLTMRASEELCDGPQSQSVVEYDLRIQDERRQVVDISGRTLNARAQKKSK